MVLRDYPDSFVVLKCFLLGLIYAVSACEEIETRDVILV